MKKTITLVPMILALLLFSACNKNAEVKQFMTDFSDAVDKNDRAAIEKMYPDAAKADSLYVGFDAETAQIEEQEDGSYKVTLDDGKELCIVKNDADGSMTIKDSHGIFAYTKERINFATKTGWIKSDMSDSEIAEQFKDSMFVNHLADKLMKALKSNLKVTNCYPESINFEYGSSKYRITVRNDNDFEIPADAYSIVITEKGWDAESLRDVVVGTKVIAGIDIKANETTSCPAPGQYDCEYSTLRASIRIDYNPEQALNQFFTPKGGEYEEYLTTK